MAQVTRTITRRSMVAGLALSASPITLAGPADRVRTGANYA